MNRPDENFEEKFISAYDKFSDAIFRHCFYRVSDKDLAKDLVQETFTKSWDYLVKGGSIRDFRLFLYKTAGNLIIDHYRKPKTVSLEDMKEMGIEPRLDITEDLYEDLNIKENLAEILEIISNLGEFSREVFIMRYVDGLSVKEIAEIREESPNAVSIRIHRGLKRIKEIYENKPKKINKVSAKVAL